MRGASSGRSNLSVTERLTGSLGAKGGRALRKTVEALANSSDGALAAAAVWRVFLRSRLPGRRGHTGEEPGAPNARFAGPTVAARSRIEDGLRPGTSTLAAWRCRPVRGRLIGAQVAEVGRYVSGAVKPVKERGPKFRAPYSGYSRRQHSRLIPFKRILYLRDLADA